MVEVVPLGASHRAFVDRHLREHFGSPAIVSLGRLHDGSVLPGLLAMLDGEPAGFLLFEQRGEACEIVALVSVLTRRGVARALVGALRDQMALAGVRRLVLVTTNDNTSAQSFYEALGFSFVALHEGAVTRSREFKPEIPALGVDGVPIEDELEYELTVHT